MQFVYIAVEANLQRKFPIPFLCMENLLRFVYSRYSSLLLPFVQLLCMG